MKLDNRLELLTMLSLIAIGSEYEDEYTDSFLNSLIQKFELNENSMPDIDNKTALILIMQAVEEIQDMIEEYQGFEREEEILH